MRRAYRILLGIAEGRKALRRIIWKFWWSVLA
jgi:hypothetical protein